MLSPLPTSAATLALPYLGYDPATFELAGQTPRGLRPYTTAEVTANFAQRVAVEKARQELTVYYNRINHTLAFPLPLTTRPSALPAGIPAMTNYPWLTWLSWAIEERWLLLLAAWRHGDAAAGALVQPELAALADWHTFTDDSGVPSLALGHIAGVLAVALQQRTQMTPATATALEQAATRLLEQNTLPWYAHHWATVKLPLTPKNLHNIPGIALTRSAQLARVLGHPCAAQLDATASELLAAWCHYRLDPRAPHTESTAYDGYFMDSVTAWLDELPTRARILNACRPALRSLIDHWIAMSLPGRVDLQIPLGDVEPEMAFWMTPLARITDWYADPCGAWLLQHLPPDRMPAAALALRLALPSTQPIPPQPPTSEGPCVTPNAVVLRNGWASAAIAASVGAGQSRMSHLHQDSGSLVISWQNRNWITDPGYQQYRQGEERDFTIGRAAHNAPQIGGVAQSQRAATILATTAAVGRHSTTLDLTACYADLPTTARIVRHVALVTAPTDDPPTSDTSPYVVVLDQLANLTVGIEIETAWQLGTHLAVAFQAGWLRLGDGKNTLWLTNTDHSLMPQQLQRHPGSRGPLTLTHVATVTAPHPMQGWLFVCHPHSTWTPPTVKAVQAIFADARHALAHH